MTTIIRNIRLNLITVDIYLNDRWWKVIVIRWTAILFKEFEMRRGYMLDCNKMFSRERASISIVYKLARIISE